MWPPTIGTLLELRAFPDVRGVLDGAPRHITKVTE
jgi:hypothetical protein